jgi:hypothetical protein
MRDLEARRLFGVAALFSGAALLAHLIAGVSLRLALVFTMSLVVFAVVLGLRQSDPQRRRHLVALAKVGLVAGVVATLVYDGARLVLGWLDPSPLDPFEAFRMFGVLLAGPERSDAVIFATGTAFHALNGLTFAIAFVLLFRRGGVWGGIGWGVFLHLFQLAFYPGWLNVRFLREFIAISLLGHIAYGASLGWIARTGRRRVGLDAPVSVGAP